MISPRARSTSAPKRGVSCVEGSRVWPWLCESSCMADPRIDEGVCDVDQEVHEHEPNGEDRHADLHHREVTATDGFDRELTHAVESKDLLDDDCTADEGADVDCRRRDQGEQRWPQRVAEE